ncbi:MAG TPA: flagellar basal-body MS-ring/collar protein FliF [Burkholderiaceae bacterium]|nr:flagellar basal-body MS-ring/collar protein FliF [Burkholderiaceae bacterium]
MNQPADLLARFPNISRPAQWPRTVQLGVVAFVVALFVVVLLWTRTPDYKVLFSDLTDRDGGAVVTALTQMNIPYQFSDDGMSILIPGNKVYETRLRLAEQGLPRSGDTGFDLLDKTRFGASQFTEQINYQRALEGELGSSIESLNSVQSARVHLAMPRESLFVRDRQPPTASVLVNLYPGRSLGEGQISAITWLVSSSVPHLNAEAVSVVDQNGRLLTHSQGEHGILTNHRSLVFDIEQRTSERILTLLTPLVGSGNVKAQVSADIDFSQHEQTSETYGPNQRPDRAAVRSKQTSDAIKHNETAAEGIPGALSNQPPADPIASLVNPGAVPADDIDPVPAAGVDDPDGAEPAGYRILSGDPSLMRPHTDRQHDQTINYEVDRTITHTKGPPNILKRISAAVVVNYRMVDGEPEALSAEELDKLENLVRQAIGFDASRGDTVSVVNSPFSQSEARQLPIWENPLYLEYAMTLGRYLLILLAAWLVWRKILKPIVSSQEPAMAVPAGPAPELQEEINRAAEAKRRASEMNRYEDNLTAVRALAEDDPRAVAMVIRSWMEKDDNRG